MAVAPRRVACWTESSLARDSSSHGGLCPLPHLLHRSGVLGPGKEAGEELWLVVAPLPPPQALQDPSENPGPSVL